MIPKAYFYPRKSFRNFSKNLQEAVKRGYTHYIRIHEFQKKPILIDFALLPAGPTISFKVKKYIPCHEILGRGVPILTQPELILKGLGTSLGLRVGRFWQSLFPPVPKLPERTVVSFINQRDFLFLRHHR